MKKAIYALLMVAVLTPSFALAQGTMNPGAAPGTMNPAPTPVMQTLPNPLGDKVSSLPDLFYKIIDFLFGFAYIVVAFFLLLSGFKFIKAQGSEDGLKDAKRTFMYTIVGALILIGTNTIIAVIKDIYAKLK